MEKPTPKITYLLLLGNFSLWGSMYVVSKFVMEQVPVFTVALSRYVIAIAVLFIIIKVKKLGRIEKGDYKYAVMIGVLGYFISLGAQLIGTKLSSASTASLVNSLNPVTMMIMATFILKEKLTVRKVVGILLSLVGVYVILGGGGSRNMLAGILISLFSVFLFSFSSVSVRKITQKYPPLLITAHGMLIAALCNLPLSVVELAVIRQPVSFNTTTVLSLLYMGVFCTAAAHMLWNTSLSMAEAGTCSAFYPVQPLVSVILGILLLHEKITTSFWLGAALIVCGVLCAILVPRRQKSTV